MITKTGVLLMIGLKLTEEESSMLVEILENFISDIRMEIADTDNSSFKENLRVQKRSVTKILLQLKENSERQA